MAHHHPPLHRRWIATLQIHHARVYDEQFHFDCYRLENEQEALEIGTEDYFYGDGISIVEWPLKIKNLIPPEAIWLTIHHISELKREIIRQD